MSQKSQYVETIYPDSDNLVSDRNSPEALMKQKMLGGN